MTVLGQFFHLQVLDSVAMCNRYEKYINKTLYLHNCFSLVFDALFVIYIEIIRRVQWQTWAYIKEVLAYIHMRGIDLLNTMEYQRLFIVNCPYAIYLFDRISIRKKS